MLSTSATYTVTIHDGTGRTIGTIKRIGSNAVELSVVSWNTPPMHIVGAFSVTIGCNVINVSEFHGRVYVHIVVGRGLHVTSGNVW